MNQELANKYREIRAAETVRLGGGARSALAQARYALRNPQQQEREHIWGNTDLEIDGFQVEVRFEPDDIWDDEDYGTLRGWGKNSDASDVACYGMKGEFVFERPGYSELLGFDLPHGETFDSILKFYRGSYSKQVAYEMAMRQVKNMFVYAVEVHKGEYVNMYVVATAYTTCECCGGRREVGHEALGGVTVKQDAIGDSYLNEQAWECIGYAVEQAKRIVAESVTEGVK